MDKMTVGQWVRLNASVIYRPHYVAQQQGGLWSLSYKSYTIFSHHTIISSLAYLNPVGGWGVVDVIDIVAPRVLSWTQVSVERLV